MRLQQSFTAMCGALAVCLLLAGCRKSEVTFRPVQIEQRDVLAWDTDGDGRADFFEYPRPDGRIDRIAYDTDGDGEPDRTVHLAEAPRSRHVVLILDGVNYSIAAETRENSHLLRYLPPPSRLIAPYPAMTDPAMSALLGAPAPPGIEARYYDRYEHRLVGSSAEYLRGANMPYNALLDFRSDTMTDAMSYVQPATQFRKELRRATALIASSDKPELRLYFVSTAGLSTKHSAEGQLTALQGIDGLIRRIVWASKGTTAVTVLADHGHRFTPARRLPLEKWLKYKGWDVTDRLTGERNVVCAPFGLVTFAGLWTNSPARLAGDLLDGSKGIALASYVEWDTVVVLAPDNQAARIRHRKGRFRYEPLRGDPLELTESLRKLTPDAQGFYGPGDLLAATAEARYPAPLQRLWRAHFGRLVQHTPDVLVSLDDDWFFGSKSFARTVRLASTHGSLNRENSTAFIATTLGPLPAVLQSRDVPAVLAHLLGQKHWPAPPAEDTPR